MKVLGGDSISLFYKVLHRSSPFPSFDPWDPTLDLSFAILLATVLVATASWPGGLLAFGLWGLGLWGFHLKAVGVRALDLRFSIEMKPAINLEMHI